MNSKINFVGGCRRVSPVFVWELEDLSERYSDSRQKFDATLTAGCVRCRFGRVKVLVCRPFSMKGRPFPTTFWLVCPYLSHKAGVLESQGGVRQLEAAIADMRQWRRYNLLHQAIRLGLTGKYERRFMLRYRRKIFRSVMRSGIGGIRQGETVSVKCLHLQAASFIGIGRHPGGDWLKAKGLSADCGGEYLCCRPCDATYVKHNPYDKLLD